MIDSTAAAPTSGIAHRLVAFGFLVMLLSTSIKSVYQVYFGPLAEHFGRGRGDFAWSGSLFMLVTGLMSPVVGALADRSGPLRTVLAGALVGGASLICASLWPDSLTAFILSYGLGGAFALAAMTYVPMGVLVDRLFEHRKSGLAYAIVSNGTSIGFIVFSPLWIWLQPQASWTTTFFATGLVFVGPIALLAWWAVRATEAGSVMPASRGNAPPSSTWAHVRSDPGFRALAIGFFGCGATMAFIDVHLIAFWQDTGTPRAQMGFSLSLLGALELVSGLATGWLAVRFDKHRMLAIFYALRSLAMLLLFSGVPEVRTIVFACVFGASYLGTVVLTSMYCLERYGVTVKGRAFGMLFLVHQAGAFLSVQLGAACFDAYGNYLPLIAVLAVLTVGGALASWVSLQRPAPLTSATPLALP
jgi:MFS family permease